MWFVFLIILLCIIIFLIAWYYTSFIKALFITKSPYVWSFNRQLGLIEQLKLEKWKTIGDLWCWDGKALRFFEKKFWLNCVWYEINSFAIFWGKIINWIKKSNCKIIKWDFLKQDISKFDYIYIYLMPSVVNDIEKWIFNNKKKEAIIIVNSFPFKNKQPFKVLDNKIYLYK